MRGHKSLRRKKRSTIHVIAKGSSPQNPNTGRSDRWVPTGSAARQVKMDRHTFVKMLILCVLGLLLIAGNVWVSSASGEGNI